MAFLFVIPIVALAWAGMIWAIHFLWHHRLGRTLSPEKLEALKQEADALTKFAEAKERVRRGY